MTCPWCSGAWITTLPTFFHVLVPDVAHVYLLALSVAAGGILLLILAKLIDRARTRLPE